MAIRLGIDARSYLAVSTGRATWPGTGAAAGLTELTNVTDVTVNLSKGEADITTRHSNGYRATVGTLKEGEITFDMLWDTTDTNFQTIFAAWDAGTPIGAAFLDGESATVGTQGLWADFTVTQFEKTESLEDAQKVSVTLKPTIVSANPGPEWIVTG